MVTRLFLPLIMLALMTSPTPATAQSCLACEAGAGDSAGADASARERPVRVTIIANLDFSRLTVRDGGGGLVVDPETGAVSPRGGAASIGGMAFSGRALVEGEPNRAVRVLMPEEIILTSSTGGQARVRRIITTLSPAPRLGPDGRLEFAFGGELQAEGGATGEFRGRIAITVGYE